MWWTSALSYLLLFLLIFGLTSTVELTNFRSSLQDVRSLVVGVGCQFVVLPLLGFAVVRMLELPPLYGLVLLVTVSSPGGSYSNWWCAISNADLALSVAMTTVSTIASIGLLPLNMLVYVNASYNTDVQIAWLSIGISILVVITAIFLGLYAGLKLPKHRGRLNTMGNVCGVLLIVLGLIFNSGSPVPLWSHSRIFYVAVSLPCILGMLISATISACLKIPGPSLVAITIEVCYQNTGIALTVALSTFGPTEAAIAAGVPLFYSAVQVVLISTFAFVCWRLGLTHCSPSTPMLKCVTLSHQPEHQSPRIAPSEGASPGLQTELDAVAESTLAIVAIRSDASDDEDKVPDRRRRPSRLSLRSSDQSRISWRKQLDAADGTVRITQAERTVTIAWRDGRPSHRYHQPLATKHVGDGKLRRASDGGLGSGPWLGPEEGSWWPSRATVSSTVPGGPFLQGADRLGRPPHVTAHTSRLHARPRSLTPLDVEMYAHGGVLAHPAPLSTPRYRRGVEVAATPVVGGEQRYHTTSQAHASAELTKTRARSTSPPSTPATSTTAAAAGVAPGDPSCKPEIGKRVSP